MINRIIDRLCRRNPDEFEVTKDDFWYSFNKDVVMNNVALEESVRNSIYQSLNMVGGGSVRLTDTTMMSSAYALNALRVATGISVYSLESGLLLIDDIQKKADIYYSYYSSTSVSLFLYLYPALSDTSEVIIDQYFNVNEANLSRYVKSLIKRLDWMKTPEGTLRKIHEIVADDDSVSKLLRENIVELKSAIRNPVTCDNGEQFILDWLSLFYDEAISEEEFCDFILERIYQEQHQCKQLHLEEIIQEPDYSIVEPTLAYKGFDRLYVPTDPKQHFLFMMRSQRKPKNALEIVGTELGLLTLYQEPIGLSHTELLSNVNIVGCTGSGVRDSHSILLDNVLRERNGAIIVINDSSDMNAREINAIYSKVVLAKRLSDLVICNIENTDEMDFEDLVSDHKIVIVLNRNKKYARADHDCIDRLVDFLELLSNTNVYFDNSILFNIDGCHATPTERFIYQADKHIKTLNSMGLGVVNFMCSFGWYDCELRQDSDLLRMNMLFRTQFVMKMEEAPKWLTMADESIRVRSRCAKPGDGILLVNGQEVHDGRLVYHEYTPQMLNMCIPYMG
ncbi:hypothetical protein LMH73_007535 [Vibrio splendidus]|nr:hypothetical protein [Vibrio splendidus]MCC4880381.1 hypothetical protein [Vibrio splendidus]